MTKSSIQESNSYWAQGGIAAAIDNYDSVDFHYDDTISVGCGLNDKIGVNIMVNEGLQRVLELIEQGVEFDDKISEEVVGFGELLPKGEYKLVNDILNKEEEELTAKKGDIVAVYEDESPIDTVLGVEIFPVVHMKTKSVIYVGLEDLK